MFTNRRAFLKTAGAVALGVSGNVYASTKGAKPITLTYSTYNPDVGTNSEIDSWFMNEVTKRTDGLVRFTRYYGGTLLPAVDSVAGLGQGVADLASVPVGAYNKAAFPLSTVTLPYLTGTSRSVSRAFSDLYDQEAAFKEEYERANINLLYVTPYDVNMLWSNKAVRSPADVKGMRIRAVLSIGDALNEMGAVVVPMSWGDAIQALSTGAIDGLSSAPLDSSASQDLGSLATHVSDVGGMGIYATQMTMINKNTFEKLSPELQSVFAEVASEVVNEAAPRIADVQLKRSIEYIAQRVSEGRLTVDFFPSELAAQTQNTLGATIQAQWLEATSKSSPEAKQILEKYKGLVARYDQQYHGTSSIEQLKVRLNSSR